MKQYLDLLKDVLDSGVGRKDRTGTGTIGVFGRQARFDLRQGFPCLTTANGQILAELPDAPLLIPGLGAQGGDLSALTGGTRTAPPTINVSRGILYKEPELSFAQKAEKYAAQIRAALNL